MLQIMKKLYFYVLPEGYLVVLTPFIEFYTSAFNMLFKKPSSFTLKFSGLKMDILHIPKRF